MVKKQFSRQYKQLWEKVLGSSRKMRTLHWIICASNHTLTQDGKAEAHGLLGERVWTKARRGCNPLGHYLSQPFLYGCEYGWNSLKASSIDCDIVRQKLKDEGTQEVCFFLLPVKVGIWGEKTRYGVRRTDYRGHVEEQVEFLHYGQNQEFLTLDHCILRSLGRMGLSGH